MYYVGRVVCGLPSGSLRYTMLPAQFKTGTIIDWDEIVPNYLVYPAGDNDAYESNLCYDVQIRLRHDSL